MRHMLALLCLILLVHAAPAVAQNEIHRCVGADGNPLFTDQPCAALQATSVSPPATAGPGSPPESPPAVLCATSVDQLRQSVVDAFASRSPNRLAGLILWGAYGRGAAIADIRSLGSMMKQPLLDISPGHEPASTDSAPPAADAPDSGSAPSVPAAGHQLVLHTVGSDGSGNPNELRFDIVHRAGCLWLRNAD